MSWPNSLPTPIKAGFYRFSSGSPSYQNVQMMVEDRFPTPYIKTIYEYGDLKAGQMTLNTWYLDVDSKEFLGERQPPQEAIDWTIEELKIYLETTFPVGKAWMPGSILAVLPEVEVPVLFKKHTPNLFVAINQYGELGFVDLVEQKSLMELPFDHEMTEEIKKAAIQSGWELIQDEGDHNYPPRYDDGIYDQKTYSFYPGTRCGWCGSSSIRPFFIGEAQCLACHSKGDSVESRDNMNLSEDWA